NTSLGNHKTHTESITKLWMYRLSEIEKNLKHYEKYLMEECTNKTTIPVNLSLEAIDTYITDFIFFGINNACEYLNHNLDHHQANVVKYRL
ncbi:43554_t:CDS:1, partial [Gigaspora margarita]